MLFEKIQESCVYIRSVTSFKPSLGIVLGTGLGSLANEIETQVSIDYRDIPHFPVSTVKSHAGKLIFGKINGMPLVAMSGRFHYYEGYSMQQVTFPLRVMKALGVGQVFLSNAAGSTNANMETGDIVFIKDQINLMPDNPLRGANDERLGVRFPDLLKTYDEELIRKAMAVAKQNSIQAHTGVYVALPGPNLETPAEYNFLHRIGGDVVGMSTVPEVLVARHAGMKVFVVSVVSNKCYPIESLTETTLEEVVAVVKEVGPKVALVVKALLAL